MTCISNPVVQWNELNDSIETCDRCPRLREHCKQIGVVRRAAYREQTYWSRPVANLGSPESRLLILGLAPGAHGANRTGRLFTGDKSGDFLFRAMHAEGFCNQPTSRDSEDGLMLIDCAITGVAHCAPPGNKPTREEIGNCRGFLDATIDAMPALKGIVVLGRIAFDAAMRLYLQRRWVGTSEARPRFSHGALHTFQGAPFLLCAYHPSQQNTFTGRLTQPMLRGVFSEARRAMKEGAK